MGLPEPKVQRRCRPVEAVMVSLSAGSDTSGPTVRLRRPPFFAWQGQYLRDRESIPHRLPLIIRSPSHGGPIPGPGRKGCRFAALYLLTRQLQDGVHTSNRPCSSDWQGGASTQARSA